MDRKHKLGRQGRYVWGDTVVGYVDDSLRLFLKAIERVAPQALASLRDEVFYPSIEAIEAVDQPEPALGKPGDEAKRFRSRMFQQPSAIERVLDWERSWGLSTWHDGLQSGRFALLVGSVLKDWERAYFTEPIEGPIEPSKARLTGQPSWFPSSPQPLPWSEEEVRLITGLPTAMISWTDAYRDSIARKCLEAATWSPLLELISTNESYAQPYSPPRDVCEVMLPPPFLPIYNPGAPVNDDLQAMTWDERVEEIKRLYKKRVEDAMARQGARRVIRPLEQKPFDQLALYQVVGDSFYKIAKDAGEDRSNLRKKILSSAQEVGITLRPPEEAGK